MKKTIALLLASLLAVGCLTACGQQDKTEQTTEAAQTEAAVQTEAPAAVDKNLCATWVMPQQMELEELTVTLEMCLEFREDSTMRQYLSEQSLDEVCDAVFQQRFGSLTEEELDEKLKENGYDSREEHAKALRKAVESYLGGPAVEAFWRVRDGKIILYKSQADFRADQPQAQDMRAYTLSEDGKTLTIPYPAGDLVFKKA